MFFNTDAANAYYLRSNSKPLYDVEEDLHYAAAAAGSVRSGGGASTTHRHEVAPSRPGRVGPASSAGRSLPQPSGTTSQPAPCIITTEEEEAGYAEGPGWPSQSPPSARPLVSTLPHHSPYSLMEAVAAGSSGSTGVDLLYQARNREYSPVASGSEIWTQAAYLPRTSRPASATVTRRFPVTAGRDGALPYPKASSRPTRLPVATASAAVPDLASFDEVRGSGSGKGILQRPSSAPSNLTPARQVTAGSASAGFLPVATRTTLYSNSHERAHPALSGVCVSMQQQQQQRRRLPAAPSADYSAACRGVKGKKAHSKPLLPPPSPAARMRSSQELPDRYKAATYNIMPLADGNDHRTVGTSPGGDVDAPNVVCSRYPHPRDAPAVAEDCANRLIAVNAIPGCWEETEDVEVEPSSCTAGEESKPCDKDDEEKVNGEHDGADDSYVAPQAPWWTVDVTLTFFRGYYNSPAEEAEAMLAAATTRSPADMRVIRSVQCRAPIVPADASLEEAWGMTQSFLRCVALSAVDGTVMAAYPCSPQAYYYFDKDFNQYVQLNADTLALTSPLIRVVMVACSADNALPKEQPVLERPERGVRGAAAVPDEPLVRSPFARQQSPPRRGPHSPTSDSPFSHQRQRWMPLKEGGCRPPSRELTGPPRRRRLPFDNDAEEGSPLPTPQSLQHEYVPQEPPQQQQQQYETFDYAYTAPRNDFAPRRGESYNDEDVAYTMDEYVRYDGGYSRQPHVRPQPYQQTPPHPAEEFDMGYSQHEELADDYMVGATAAAVTERQLRASYPMSGRPQYLRHVPTAPPLSRRSPAPRRAVASLPSPGSRPLAVPAAPLACNFCGNLCDAPADRVGGVMRPSPPTPLSSSQPTYPHPPFRDGPATPPPPFSKRPAPQYFDDPIWHHSTTTTSLQPAPPSASWLRKGLPDSFVGRGASQTRLLIPTPPRSPPPPPHIAYRSTSHPYFDEPLTDTQSPQVQGTVADIITLAGAPQLQRHAGASSSSCVQDPLGALLRRSAESLQSKCQAGRPPSEQSTQVYEVAKAVEPATTTATAAARVSPDKVAPLKRLLPPSSGSDTHGTVGETTHSAVDEVERLASLAEDAAAMEAAKSITLISSATEVDAAAAAAAAAKKTGENNEAPSHQPSLHMHTVDTSSPFPVEPHSHCHDDASSEEHHRATVVAVAAAAETPKLPEEVSQKLHEPGAAPAVPVITNDVESSPLTAGMPSAAAEFMVADLLQQGTASMSDTSAAHSVGHVITAAESPRSNEDAGDEHPANAPGLVGEKSVLIQEEAVPESDGAALAPQRVTKETSEQTVEVLPEWIDDDDTQIDAHRDMMLESRVNPLYSPNAAAAAAAAEASAANKVKMESSDVALHGGEAGAAAAPEGPASIEAEYVDSVAPAAACVEVAPEGNSHAEMRDVTSMEEEKAEANVGISDGTYPVENPTAEVWVAATPAYDNGEFAEAAAPTGADHAFPEAKEEAEDVNDEAANDQDDAGLDTVRSSLHKDEEGAGAVADDMPVVAYDEGGGAEGRTGAAEDLSAEAPRTQEEVPRDESVEHLSLPPPPPPQGTIAAHDAEASVVPSNVDADGAAAAGVEPHDVQGAESANSEHHEPDVVEDAEPVVQSEEEPAEERDGQAAGSEQHDDAADRSILPDKEDEAAVHHVEAEETEGVSGDDAGAAEGKQSGEHSSAASVPVDRDEYKGTEPAAGDGTEAAKAATTEEANVEAPHAQEERAGSMIPPPEADEEGTPMAVPVKFPTSAAADAQHAVSLHEEGATEMSVSSDKPAAETAASSHIAEAAPDVANVQEEREAFADAAVATAAADTEVDKDHVFLPPLTSEEAEEVVHDNDVAVSDAAAVSAEPSAPMADQEKEPAAEDLYAGQDHHEDSAQCATRQEGNHFEGGDDIAKCTEAVGSTAYDSINAATNGAALLDAPNGFIRAAESDPDLMAGADAKETEEAGDGLAQSANLPAEVEVVAAPVVEAGVMRVVHHGGAEGTVGNAPEFISPPPQMLEGNVVDESEHLPLDTETSLLATSTGSHHDAAFADAALPIELHKTVEDNGVVAVTHSSAPSTEHEALAGDHDDSAGAPDTPLADVDTSRCNETSAPGVQEEATVAPAPEVVSVVTAAVPEDEGTQVEEAAGEESATLPSYYTTSIDKEESEALEESYRHSTNCDAAINAPEDIEQFHTEVDLAETADVEDGDEPGPRDIVAPAADADGPDDLAKASNEVTTLMEPDTKAEVEDVEVAVASSCNGAVAEERTEAVSDITLVETELNNEDQGDMAIADDAAAAVLDNRSQDAGERSGDPSTPAKADSVLVAAEEQTAVEATQTSALGASPEGHESPTVAVEGNDTEEATATAAASKTQTGNASSDYRPAPLKLNHMDHYSGLVDFGNGSIEHLAQLQDDFDAPPMFQRSGIGMLKSAAASSVSIEMAPATATTKPSGSGVAVSVAATDSRPHKSQGTDNEAEDASHVNTTATTHGYDNEEAMVDAPMNAFRDSMSITHTPTITRREREEGAEREDSSAAGTTTSAGDVAEMLVRIACAMTGDSAEAVNAAHDHAAGEPATQMHKKASATHDFETPAASATPQSPLAADSVVEREGENFTTAVVETAWSNPPDPISDISNATQVDGPTGMAEQQLCQTPANAVNEEVGQTFTSEVAVELEGNPTSASAATASEGDAVPNPALQTVEDEVTVQEQHLPPSPASLLAPSSTAAAAAAATPESDAQLRRDSLDQQQQQLELPAAPCNDGAMRKTMVLLGFPGSAWEFIMTHHYEQMHEAFVTDAAAAANVPYSAIQDVRYSKGSLMVDLYVLHPASIGEHEMRDQMCNFNYPRLWALYEKKKRERKKLLHGENGGILRGSRTMPPMTTALSAQEEVKWSPHA
jgi:hypothetical protein